MILYFGIKQSGLIEKINDIMIVFNRNLKESDLLNIEENEEELIFYKDNNIAYTIIKSTNIYILRQYKIFNRQLMSENKFKTQQQVINHVNMINTF